MGYHFPSTVFRLHFEDGRMAGLEVECRTGSIAQYEAIGKLADAHDVAPDALMVRLCKAFSKSLIRWNLEDDQGTPTPATLEGLLDQDVELVTLVVDAWLDSVLARRRSENATDEDKEQAAALADFTHELV